MLAQAVILRNGTIVEDVRLADSAFEAGVIAARMLVGHPVAIHAEDMECGDDWVEVMDGEYRVDVWDVDVNAEAAEVWIGVYIAPEGYLDTVNVLTDQRAAHTWVIAEPTDPSTFQVLDQNHICAADDPHDEGGYTHAFRVVRVGGS